jgi:predicted RNase H-like nuclease (RuvC/YqgF family)
MQPDARLFLLMALAVLTLAIHRPAAAQAARSSSGNAQAMQQLQQLAAERTRLLADNAKLKSDLDASRKELDALKKKQDASERRLQGNDGAVARANARSDSLSQELAREKGRLAELVTKFREMASQFREVESDRNTVKASLGQRDVELKQCIDRNLSLYALNGEVLGKLESRGGFTPASALEPFTKLKRIELENLIDGYQTRADEQRPPSAALQAPSSR